MNWEFVIIAIFGIAGAALIVGGIVAYRRSARTKVRAFSAAAVAAGVVMWAIIALIIPVSSTSDVSPAPTVVQVGMSATEGVGESTASTLTEEKFMTLLTVEDLRGVLTTEISSQTPLLDYKEMAIRVDPAQVVNIDSWYGLGFQSEDGMRGMTLSAIDFDSVVSAQAHFEMMKSETPEMQDMLLPIEDASIQIEVNAQGIGSMLVFIKGDKVVLLHTAQPEGQRPLLPLEGLEELAELVASRL